MESLLTIREVSDLLRLSKSKCYELKEKIGYLRVGGAIRFRQEDLEEYLAACREDRQAKSQPQYRPRLKHISV